MAKGDYTQTVSYLGEFSKAFNTMTAQLKERENALKQEAQREKEHADLMEREAHWHRLCGKSPQQLCYRGTSAAGRRGDVPAEASV